VIFTGHSAERDSLPVVPGPSIRENLGKQATTQTILLHAMVLLHEQKLENH